MATPETTCMSARTTRRPGSARGNVAGPIIERRPKPAATPTRILLGFVEKRFNTRARSAAPIAGTKLATITWPTGSADGG